MPFLPPNQQRQSTEGIYLLPTMCQQQTDSQVCDKILDKKLTHAGVQKKVQSNLYKQIPLKWTTRLNGYHLSGPV